MQHFISRIPAPYTSNCTKNWLLSNYTKYSDIANWTYTLPVSGLPLY